MDTDRKEKLTVSITVVAVLLLVVLIAVLVYQLITISVKKREESSLDEQIAILREMTEQGKSDIEIHSQKWWVEQRARELGYFYNKDIPLD